MSRQSQIINRSKLQLSLIFLSALMFLGMATLFSTVSFDFRAIASENDKGTASRTDKTQTCPTCRQPTQQVIYTPLIELREALYAEINLNCRSSHPIDVVPTFYTDDGTSIVGETIQLKSAEMRFVKVTDLIPAEHRNRHRWGGMSLSYLGNSMEVWAQMTFHNANRNGSTNSFFAVVDAPRSNVREAVWRAPKNSTAAIALGNYSDYPTAATLTFSNGDVEQVNIAPYATEIIRRRNNGQNQSSIEAESVRIDASGQMGRLIPIGFVSSANGDFSSSIRFADTENIAQSNLYATNFRLKDSTPHIILKNTSTDAIAARPRFLPALGEGSGVVELASIVIPANGIKELNLTALINAARTRTDLESVSVQIINSGDRGSLIGAANFTNNVTGIDYDIPLRDSGTAANSAGGYPVRLDGDYTTTLSITNVGNKAGKFTMQINFESGLYALYPQELAPGATAVFDIRSIRDQQIPDSEGRRLPANLAVGQIRWSIVGAPQTRLIGRSEVISKTGKVSSSYSCGVCCPNSYYNGSVMPVVAEVDAGDTYKFTSQQQDRDCYHNLYSPYPVSANWTTDNGDVASVTSEGLATAISGGDAYLTASWTGQLWLSDPTDACILDEIPAAPTAEIIVRPRVLDVSPNGATRVIQVVGDTNIIHIVTPKGAAGSQVTLTAIIQYSDPHVPNDIDWEGATKSPTNPLQATLLKDTASKNIVKIKYRGNVIKELRVWVVWSEISSTDIPINVFPAQTGNPLGLGIGTSGGYDFTHRIRPAEIITDPNRPNFSGARTTPPPGGSHPIYGTSLAGGADRKWDNSRQIRFKTLNPSNISANDTAFYPYGQVPDVLNYPANDAEGNDDSTTSDPETNDPYSNGGVLTGHDLTQFAIAHRAGVNGDTYELRLQFREFTRLEIEGVWYRISDFYLWRMHHRYVKNGGVWVDGGTSKALDNAGF